MESTPFFIYKQFAAVPSFFAWVFTLFSTIKSEPTKLDKRFDLVLLTFEGLSASDPLLA